MTLETMKKNRFGREVYSIREEIREVYRKSKEAVESILDEDINPIIGSATLDNPINYLEVSEEKISFSFEDAFNDKYGTKVGRKEISVKELINFKGLLCELTFFLDREMVELVPHSEGKLGRLLIKSAHDYVSKENKHAKEHHLPTMVEYDIIEAEKDAYDRACKAFFGEYLSYVEYDNEVNEAYITVSEEFFK